MRNILAKILLMMCATVILACELRAVNTTINQDESTVASEEAVKVLTIKINSLEELEQVADVKDLLKAKDQLTLLSMPNSIVKKLLTQHGPKYEKKFFKRHLYGLIGSGTLGLSLGVTVGSISFALLPTYKTQAVLASAVLLPPIALTAYYLFSKTTLYIWEQTKVHQQFPGRFLDNLLLLHKSILRKTNYLKNLPPKN